MNALRSTSTATRLILAGFAVMLAGCMSPWFSNRESADARREEIRGKLESENRPTIIAQVGSPILTQTRLQNIALVTQLHHTGGPVKASSQREKIIDEMRRKDAKNPNAILDSDSTTMAVARLNVMPAARRGQIVDVAIDISMHSTATSLEHGFLLETSLMEMSRLGGLVREGFERAVAQGPIVTRQQISGETDSQSELQGMLVGGGRLLKSRDLGITINDEFADALTMHAIVPAINSRFTVFDGTKQKGVATPQENNYIEIVVPPRYDLDPFHFANVVTQTSFNETESQLAERMQRLAEQLHEPAKTRVSCWQLEAIGRQAIPVLAAGIDDVDPEVQFYSAHSLAYLNDERAIPVVAKLARTQPAFRAMCFNALVKVDSPIATDTLKEMLHAADAEVKYGAVRALRMRDASEPSISPQAVGQTGNLLEIPSSGAPLVAASLTQTREVVIFGEAPRLHMSGPHQFGKRIILTPAATGLTVTNLRPDLEPLSVHTNNELPNVLRTIAEVGGTYGDWIQFLRECHDNNFFIEPFAMNPVALTGRTYNRRDPNQLAGDGSETNFTVAATTKTAEESTTGRLWYNPLTWTK